MKDKKCKESPKKIQWVFFIYEDGAESLSETNGQVIRYACHRAAFVHKCIHLYIMYTFIYYVYIYILGNRIKSTRKKIPPIKSL